VLCVLILAGATIKTVKKAKGLDEISFEADDTKPGLQRARPSFSNPSTGAAVANAANNGAKRPGAAPSKGESKEEKGKIGTPAKTMALPQSQPEEVIEEIEGWLALQVGTDEQWYTRYFRLIGTDFVAYEEKEKVLRFSSPHILIN
jgi:hypothetical protein